MLSANAPCFVPSAKMYPDSRLSVKSPEFVPSSNKKKPIPTPTPTHTPAPAPTPATRPQETSLSAKSSEFIPNTKIRAKNNASQSPATRSFKAHVFAPAKIYPDKKKVSPPTPVVPVAPVVPVEPVEPVWIHHGLDIDYSDCSPIPPPAPRIVFRLKALMNKLM